MAITLTDAQQTLAHLLGEGAPPGASTTEYQQRTTFIQATLREIYRLHPFDMNRVSATVSVVNGVASLPSGVAGDTRLDVRRVYGGAGDDHVYDRISYSEQDAYPQGSYRYWLSGSEGSLTLNTKEGDADLSIQYTTTAPDINASVSTPFPDPMILALGAIRYVRKAQNPFADTTEEEESFKDRLTEYIAQYNRNTPRKLYRTVQERAGTWTGDIG